MEQKTTEHQGQDTEELDQEIVTIAREKLPITVRTRPRTRLLRQRAEIFRAIDDEKAASLVELAEATDLFAAVLERLQSVINKQVIYTVGLASLAFGLFELIRKDASGLPFVLIGLTCIKMGLGRKSDPPNKKAESGE